MGLQRTCPWDSPGKNTGVGCHALLQGIFPTQGSNPGLPHSRRILYQLSPTFPSLRVTFWSKRTSHLRPILISAKLAHTCSVGSHPNPDIHYRFCQITHLCQLPTQLWQRGSSGFPADHNCWSFCSVKKRIAGLPFSLGSPQCESLV